METKQIFTITAMLAVASTLSCSKETDDDKRDQFAGTYSVALTVTTTGNTVLVNDTTTVTVTKSGAENFIVQASFYLQQFPVGMTLTTDSVFWHHAAGKSSVFKIPEQPAQISGANVGNVKGVSLGSTSYHGGFGYDSNADAPKLNMKVAGSLTPFDNMVIPITVTISGIILK
jgi:hypothetical protein